MQHLLVRLTALVRISSNKLGENIAATVLQEELQVSSVCIRDIAQHGEKLPLAQHRLGLAGHARRCEWFHLCRPRTCSENFLAHVRFIADEIVKPPPSFFS